MLNDTPNVMTELAPKGPRFVKMIEIMVDRTYRPGNTDLRGLKVEIGHNGVIHTLDPGPNLVAKGQIGSDLF